LTEHRARIGSFIDRHATILTIIAMAALVLIPTKIAYDASGNATDAGDTATKAARKARHAVVRLENERRQRIYDQNGIDRYFCGKSAAIEKILTLLLTASLDVETPTEVNESQRNARAVFERVLAELSEAPKCEVLIPAPPKPRPGESKSKGTREEARAQRHPTETQQLEETPPVIHVPQGGGTAPVQKHPGTGGSHEGDSQGHHHTGKEHEPTANEPEPSGEESSPASATPTSAPKSEEANGSVGEAPTAPPEEMPQAEPQPAPKGLVPGAVEAVGGIVGCVTSLNVPCTLHEVLGGSETGP
jgi:hypothetical protein